VLLTGWGIERPTRSTPGTCGAEVTRPTAAECGLHCRSITMLDTGTMRWLSSASICESSICVYPCKNRTAVPRSMFKVQGFQLNTQNSTLNTAFPLSLHCPVLHFQALDPAEMSCVVGHKDQIVRQGTGSESQVEIIEGNPRILQRCFERPKSMR
jgi:hypothetical protein